jgi:hypothetical protein
MNSPLCAERVETLHCVGESHCLRFRDRLYRSPSAQRWLHTRCHFLPRVEASNFTADGGLHEDLAAALLAAGLCQEQTQDDGSVVVAATHRATTFAERVLAARHAALADSPLIAPALLLFAGDKELHSLAMTLGPEVDFELPEGLGPIVVPGARRLPFASIEAAFAARLEPFCTGLQMLRDAGFDRTLVHGLLPRVRDDLRVAQWCHGVQVAAAVRRKLEWLGNHLLAAACRAAGVGFVDVRPALGRDGYLAPRFDLDGVHASALATDASFPSVITALAAIEGGLNTAQYELLHELAVARDAPPEASFAERGFAVWSAEQQPAVAGLATAADDLASLSTSLDALRPLLEVGWERESGLVGVALAKPTELGLVPPIPVRAALCVQRRAQILCEPSIAGPAVATVELAPGGLLVYDPSRIRVRCDDPQDTALQLFVLPRLPAEPPSAVLLRDAAWPADPFWVPCASGADAQPAVRRWREVIGRTVDAAS